MIIKEGEKVDDDGGIGVVQSEVKGVNIEKEMPLAAKPAPAKGTGHSPL